MGSKTRQDVDDLESEWAYDYETPHKHWGLRQVTGSSYGLDSSVSLLLTDPELLQCFECDERLTIPVFQSEDGGKLFCKSCSSSTSNIKRSKLAERILDSVAIPCKYAKFGCNGTSGFDDTFRHEQNCSYGTNLCPFLGCNAQNLSGKLVAHMRSKHSNSFVPFTDGKSFSLPPSLIQDKEPSVSVLQERETRALVILDINVRSEGVAVSLVQLLGESSCDFFKYEIRAGNGTSVSDDMWSIHDWDQDNPNENVFLLISNKDIRSSSICSLVVKISSD